MQENQLSMESDAPQAVKRQHQEAMQSCALATRAMHADDPLSKVTDVAPPMHVSTTFRYSDDPNKLKPANEWEVFRDLRNPPVDALIYSREAAPNTNRIEAIVSAMTNGRALSYSSGLAAFHALMVHLNPKRIAIGEGYHGCHGVLGVMSKLTGLKKVDLHGDEAAWDDAGLGKGDVIHVETPLNPTGEAYDLSEYARRAHARGAYLTVDATFGPPGLQDPFKHGADAVMHSGTKYLGGHSDMLCGLLIVQRDDWWWSMFWERLHLGSVMGSFEGWLGVRSLRTLDLRVRRQSETTEKLVKWLYASLQRSTLDHGASPHPTLEEAALVSRTVVKITHASLQAANAPWLKDQMPNGYGPVFSIMTRSAETARRLPSNLMLFHHATSLGGVESLIEWRKMSDDHVDERLLRISVGVEDVEDLWADLMRGLKGIDVVG